ncbi:hypothetical protein NOF55_00635 [Rhizobiaceae bacterium BDR2-2]|uniref:Uncharacterized protein n=1 Tax=Ectorhizobium quercum TaxID=2965071 RepID=A0AAE3MXR6_9HYPH|nr:hypothetical protein [Ectorhizobium quercum]MCX8995610.1 hypothetical protein [Ectorhizobium quercum]
MLTPIQSVSNMTVQHKVPPRQEHGGQQRGGQAQYQGQHQGERQEQAPVAVSSAATGRMNVLNLSGLDAPTKEMARLSQAIGKALDMPALPGESAAMHALRLAEAVLDLNGGERMALERQLAHTLQGLSLQLVALALKHPGGPEAARISAYLELYRHKGDPVTQAVVASYLQNEGDEENGFGTPVLRQPRPEIELQGRMLSPMLEAQLSQAAHSAAMRAGIALPYVSYAIDDAQADAEEDIERRHAPHRGDDEDASGEESSQHGDDGLLLSSDEDGEEDAAGETAGDDMAYTYYQRMSGGL